MSPPLSRFYPPWFTEIMPGQGDIALKAGMAAYKHWLYRNYLAVILVCLALAVLIWWIFHQRIQRIEDQLKESSQRQTVQLATVNTFIYA